jgi:hypothetical protein
MAGLIAFLGVSLIGVIVVLAYVLLHPAETNQPEQMELLVAAPTTSTIRVKVKPVAGKVSFDGRLVGEREEVVIDQVTPGMEHVLRVEADGYEPYEEKISLEAGSTEAVPVVLTAKAAPPTPTPPTTPVDTNHVETNNTPVLRVISNPSGAEVYVGGKLVGKTPMDWPGRPNERVALELRMTGYQSSKSLVNLPRSGRDTQSFNLVAGKNDATPAPVPGGTGKLSVTVRGGWATVYIDGIKKGDAPKTWELTAGPHQIRTINPETGLDKTQQVIIKTGETAQITVSAE